MVEAVHQAREELIERVSEEDEQLMISYIEGHEISESELRKAIRRATLAGRVTPVFCGSALRNKGVQLMLDAVVDYLPAPIDVPPVFGTEPKSGELIERAPDDEQPFCGLAFKIVVDPYVGRLTYFRIYSGKVEPGQQVLNASRRERERFGKIFVMHANHREEVKGAVYAGSIAAVGGLKETYTGDTLSAPESPIVLESIRFPEPVISVAIEPKTKADQDKMGIALGRLAEEDPTFRVRYDEETGQTIISGMGELHLDVLVDRMKREYQSTQTLGGRRSLIAKPSRSRQERRAVSSVRRAVAVSLATSGSRSSHVSVEPDLSSSTKSSAAQFRGSSYPQLKPAYAMRWRAVLSPAIRWSTSPSPSSMVAIIRSTHPKWHSAWPDRSAQKKPSNGRVQSCSSRS